MKYFLFLLATSVFYKDSLGIYGGYMSYSTMPSNINRHVKVEILFLNGWKLHKGPCYNCTESDEGHDVTARRRMYIQDYGNPDVFGSWGFEPEVRFANANKTLITNDVNHNIKDIVLMVNNHEQWEMESSKITLDIDLSTTYTGIFDITFENGPDGVMTKIPNMNTMFLQVKVDANVRTDTNKPNNSPIILVKPYYSLELGKTYKLHIPVIDNDGDQVHCDISRYVEAKGFNTFIHELNRSNLLTVDNKACIIMLTVRYPEFKVGDTFGIPVTLKDYGQKDTAVGSSLHQAYLTSFGRLVVLMYFKVTTNTHPPRFVPPTPPNNQKYTIYVGGDFHVNVYAKPTQQNRFITKFNVLRRDGKPVNQTRHVTLWDPKIEYISISWSPVNDDKGHHIICANAEDSAGVSTVELHCFRIEVKVYRYRPNQQIQGKPYYASFPEPQDIVCPVRTYCRFPVYAATTNTGDSVKKIVSTTESKEKVSIKYGHDAIYGNQSTKVAQVEFFADKIGVRQICLNASDTLAWTEQCLYVTVQRPDPCASVPCLNGGLCSPSEDNSEFQCYCDRKYSGHFCEIVNGPCDMERTPCFNSTCIPNNYPPFYFCVDCAPGKTGFNCDQDNDLCHPNKCHRNEICHQSGKYFDCLSAKPTDSCPTGCTLNASTVCVQNNCVCAMGMVNDGVCRREINLPLDTAPHFVSPTPEIGSVITCDVNEFICHFAIYISSGTIPCASVFNNTIESSIRSINFSTPQKDISSDVYQTTVSIKRTYDPVPHYKEFDLCLNVAKLSACLSFTDKRCFHVAIKAVPAVKNNEKQIPRQYPGCSFSLQTPQRDSIIGCKKGNPCHFFMYAETNGTCPILNTNDINTGIYTPILITGLCRYEVVYTNTSTSGRKTVCFMLCSKGESRCYQIFTNAIADQCLSNPCKNNAHCQTTPAGSVKCHCQKGYKGLYCEKGLCRNNLSCKNGAACLMNFDDTECVCRPGFIGDFCSQNLNQNSTNKVDYSGHFTMMNRLEKMTCYINGQCTVPFSIINNNHTVLKVDVGYFHKTIEVQSLILEKSRYLGGIINGILTVVCRELGNKMMCSDSFEALRSATIKDEICFTINVTEGKYMKPQKLFPYFVRPTLPNSTVIQCVVKDRCYLNLWAENILGMNKCPLLQTDKTIEDGVFILPFYNNPTHQPCLYDVSILRDNATDLQICFSLLRDSSEQYAVFKDQRCYFIKFVNELKGKGTCAGKFCNNDGFCDGSSSTYKCLCRFGFSGINCSESHGNVKDTLMPSHEQVAFGDLAFPKSVYCEYNTECLVLFSVSNSSGFHTGWNGTNIDVINIRYEKIPSSLDVIGKVVLVHKSTGTDPFCILLSLTNGTSAYVKCCSIFMESVHPKTFPDYGQARFIWPSPKNGTVFACTSGRPCHVLITLSKEYNNVNCPVLKDKTGDGISTHIFVSNFTSKCRYDVWIGSSLSDNRKTKDYCFQSPTFGVLAEIRCFKVYFDQHAQNEATTTITPSSIGSTANTSHSGLMCPNRDAAMNCVWNRTCYPGQVCMIRSFHGATVVHCSEKENCNFIKANVPHVEILCCEDHQCINNICIIQ